MNVDARGFSGRVIKLDGYYGLREARSEVGQWRNWERALYREESAVIVSR